jgi:hypothetical protein
MRCYVQTPMNSSASCAAASILIALFASGCHGGGEAPPTFPIPHKIDAEWTIEVPRGFLVRREGSAVFFTHGDRAVRAQVHASGMLDSLIAARGLQSQQASLYRKRQLLMKTFLGDRNGRSTYTAFVESPASVLALDIDVGSAELEWAKRVCWSATSTSAAR